MVNGKIAKLGDKANLKTDDIRVYGQKINRAISKKTYIILNKPKYVLSDIKDPRNRKTVVDLVDHDGYLFIVGRLDFRSEGLILLTDDGDIANRLTHPRYEHEKEYQVLVQSSPTKDQFARWEEGVRLPDGRKTLPTRVRKISSSDDGTWLSIVLREGKKRQIREIGKIVGLSVRRIIRTRIGPIRLGSLQPGEWRYLTSPEIMALKKAAQ
jgi:23S rRNA pseudouridine2605 synthase